MGTKIKFAGDTDFGAFAFVGEQEYDVDDLGDLPDNFLEKAKAAGAAVIESKPRKPRASEK